MASTLAWPIRRNADHTFAAVEQDSPQEIRQAVAIVLAIPVGSLIDKPRFGRAAQEFRMGGADTTGLQAAITRWEPRATPDVTAGAIREHIQNVAVDAAPAP